MGQDKAKQGHLPRPPKSNRQLVLVDTVAVLVPLEFFTVVGHKAHHVIRGDTALLDVLASRVEARIGGLSQTGLEGKERAVFCHGRPRDSSKGLHFYMPCCIQRYAPHHGEARRA